ncbi:MAG: YjjG family noncanonical pyrimidine nucleotidase [Prevotella sp.]|nr:YjjG family noncanonical pyrimidine nucleotidase [Prevotella sp.]
MKYLLFDLDRTLWDFEGNAEKTYRAMFAEYGLETLCHTDYETFHERYRVINDTLWEAYRNGTLSKEVLALSRFSLTLEAFGMPHDAIETVRLSQQLSDYYVLRGPQQTGLMPNARETLEWIACQKDSFRMAVITNGFSEAQLPKMKTSRIDGYFDWVLLSEQLGAMKPDRRFFELALNTIGANAKDCLVIGDDYKVDIAGAAAAGIEQVYYNIQSRPLPEGAAKPTYEISDLLEMKELLAQWGKQK